MQIIGVFKTHFDYGYTDSAEAIRKKYRTEIIEQVIRVCKRTENRGAALAYKWTLPSWLLMDIYNNAEESVKADMKALIEKDRIFCHALPFTMHTELLDERQISEDIFAPAEAFCATFSKPFPISAKMTDVPGHTCALIKPLVERGVKFLHLGKNPYSTAPDVPLLFWWEDTQGNRILVMYTRFYGSQIKPPRGWKYPVWLALMQTSDNVGGHDERMLDEMQAEVPKGAEFRIGSMDDFARAILQCDLSDLPVIRGELGDSWIHGAGTYPCVMGRFRRARKRLYALTDTAKARGIDVSDLTAPCKDLALQFCEHTFGINICRYIGYDREYYKQAFLRERRRNKGWRIAEKSWEEQRERVYGMEALLDRMEERVGSESECAKPEAQGYQILLEDGKPTIILPSGKKITPEYEYKIYGADALNAYIKKYVVRYCDWSMVDLGKLRYPEIGDVTYKRKPYKTEETDGKLVAYYQAKEESFEKYGNAKRWKAVYSHSERGVRVDLYLEEKQATPFVEAGNMCFKVQGQEENCGYFVDKCGLEIDVEKDIVKDSNTALWAMNEYARMGNIKLYSYDAPLVSFGKSAIMQFNGGKPKKQRPTFVVNLFNNQWGTNFPQWIEGNFSFTFEIMEE